MLLISELEATLAVDGPTRAAEALPALLADEAGGAERNA